MSAVPNWTPINKAVIILAILMPVWRRQLTDWVLPRVDAAAAPGLKRRWEETHPGMRWEDRERL